MPQDDVILACLIKRTVSPLFFPSVSIPYLRCHEQTNLHTNHQHSTTIPHIQQERGHHLYHHFRGRRTEEHPPCLSLHPSPSSMLALLSLLVYPPSSFFLYSSSLASSLGLPLSSKMKQILT